MNGGRDVREIPSDRTVRGRVRVPPSKSITHRALALAVLAERPLTLESPLVAEDTDLFRGALQRLGWTVEVTPSKWRLRPGRRPPRARFDCGNAGTMARLLVALLSTLPGDWTVDGSERLRERPVDGLVRALRRLGALVSSETFPLTVSGPSLRGGEVEIDASTSSQYVSALLIAACRAEEPVTVEARGLRSAPYVEVTLRVLDAFGVRVERLPDGRRRVHPSGVEGPPGGRFRVEGDASAACYPAAAAALAGGRVRIEGVARDSAQGDVAFLEILASMGAAVEWAGDGVDVRGAELRAVDVDMADLPDQVPTLAALAPFAHGETRIRNVPHLRVKESDRLAAMALGLRRLGVPVEEFPDGLRVSGVWGNRSAVPSEPEPVRIDPQQDHRIAMSFAIAGLRRPGVRIEQPDCVTKSYPDFWRDLDHLLGD